jgi:hypothetical protein
MNNTIRIEDNEDDFSFYSVKDLTENLACVLTKGVYKTDAGWVAVMPGHEQEVAQQMVFALCDVMGWDDIPEKYGDPDD